MVFCTPLLLAWALVELWTAKTVPNSYALRRQKLEAQREQVDTLILGSSRAAYGIVPRQLPGFAFNLAGLAQSLYYDYRLMNRVLPELPKLKRAIIEIQDQSLFYQLQDGDAWRQYYYQQEWGIPPPNLRSWLDVRMFSRVALRPQSYSEALPAALRSLVEGTKFVPNPSALDIDDRGWQGAPSETPPDLSPAGVAAALTWHAFLMRASYESTNSAYLNRMLSALRPRGIETVLVTLPVPTNYSSGMNKEYWARTQAAIRRLAAEYSFRYLCFLAVPTLGKGDFLDADHLNRQGAVRFTELLRFALGHSATSADESSCGCCSR